MTSSTPVARLVGALLTVQLAGLIVPFALLAPLMPAEFLQTAAERSTQLKTAVALLFLNGALTVGISVVLWPILRPRSERGTVLLVAAAVAMFTLQAVDNAHLLTMVSLSRRHLTEGGGELLVAMGALVRETRRWLHYTALLGIELWIGTLYGLLLCSGLVPRALALAGLTTVLLHFAGVVLPFWLGRPGVVPLAMAMGVAHLVLAWWLVTRGFRVAE